MLQVELEYRNVQANREQNAIRVLKAAGQKSVEGVFYLKASDTLAAEGHTLVNMMRSKVCCNQSVHRQADEKGSILHWRAFWWSIVRHRQIEPYVVKGDP